MAEKERPLDVQVLLDQVVEALVVKDRQHVQEQELLILVVAVVELAKSQALEAQADQES